MRRGRILVVEDDETLRETLAEVIGDDGHEVRTADNGGTALEVIGGWEPDLIVLDLMMPHMDAFAFRERHRRMPGAAATRVLVLSAARDVEAAAGRLAADAWVAKPFALADVLGVIERLLAGDGGTGTAPTRS
jgi:CheY-like chemotaxis protein